LTEKNDILKALPHAFPFRMIDRILEIEPEKRAVALKNVSSDEPWFSGYGRTQWGMPWVLILEGLAQTGGFALRSSDKKEERETSPPFLAAVDQFELKGKVNPGDQLILEAEVERLFPPLAKVKVWARVEKEIVAEGTLVLSMG
jgi:3-hydroxyacyl-[acyl-carrier-protein] dehydratase